MSRLIVALATVLVSASSAGALEERNAVHATPPLVPHPMPQGVPYVTVGNEARPIVALRYGVINGRRALLNAETLEVVYFLHP